MENNIPGKRDHLKVHSNVLVEKILCVNYPYLQIKIQSLLLASYESNNEEDIEEFLNPKT